MRYLLLALALALALVLGVPAAASAAPAPAVSSIEGVAIGGYDATAYFTEGRPVRGSAAFAHS